MKKSFSSWRWLAVISLIVLPACSIKKLAMNQVANALTGSGLEHGFHRRQRPRTGGRRPALRHQDVRIADGRQSRPHGADACRPAACTSCTPTLSCRLRRTMLPEERIQEAGVHLRAGPRTSTCAAATSFSSALENKYPGFAQALQKRDYRPGPGTHHPQGCPLALLGRGRLAGSVRHRPLRHGPGDDPARGRGA